MKLGKWYRAYNKRWFGGKLPPCKVKWKHLAHRMQGCTAFYQCGKKLRFKIYLHSATRKVFTVWNLTLLHEMCHVWVMYNDPGKLNRLADHGRVWQNKMLELARRGAFKKLW